MGFSQQVPEELIALAKKGDMRAFEELYNTFGKACYSLAFRICGQKATAQDVTQEVFIKVMTKIRKLENEAGFGRWLRTITANETISRLRTNKRLQLVGDDDWIINSQESAFDGSWLDDVQDLQKYLDRLSENARAVLWLHVVEGYSHAEIGAFFKCSESFSKVTLSRALKLIKDSIKKEVSDAPIR